MKILYAAYEAGPFFQTGGLGDVARSLPIALSKINVATTLVLPNYRLLKLPQPPKKLGTFEIDFDAKKEKINILSLPVSQNINLFIVDHPLLAGATQRQNKAEKFILFSKAIAAMVAFGDRKIYGSFDLIHLNDWHSATVSVFLNKLAGIAQTPPTLLTIHNLLYQGPVKKERLHFLLGLDLAKYNFTTPLEVGLFFADRISTVSLTYAREIVNTKLGLQLRKLLYKRRERVSGILNGIDTSVWNPRDDKLIYSNFGLTDTAKSKKINKLAFQKEFKLPISETLLLISFIGRLEPNQKGIDLIYFAFKKLLSENSFQFILLGTGNEEWAAKISELVRRYPKRIVFINKFDQIIAHKVYASSDMVLVPSKYEPCGLVQMIAMRYGALPLVRKTGGLADTVKDEVNGFTFNEYSSTALARTLRLAIQAFNQEPLKIEKMRVQAMKEDFSWVKSAKAYKNLYQKVIKENRASKYKLV